MNYNIKEFCNSFLKAGLPGFDLAVYKDGQCVLRHMDGYSDLENKVKIDGKERYNIYSCSKLITCTAALQLWEKGLFSLEDKLSDYMPEFERMTVRKGEETVKAEKPILIRHLFEMTAGFDYNLWSKSLKQARTDTNGRCETRQVMKYLAKEPLLFQPGEGWFYGLSHDVLAAFVEVVSGVRFSKYVKESIFDPLGMTNSTFMLSQNELDTISCQYEYNWDQKKYVNVGKDICDYKLGSEYESGGAGCISTVDDYIKFLEALRIGDIILKKDTVKLMSSDRLTPTQKSFYTPLLNAYHGFGLGVRTSKKDSIFSEFGWAGAAGAYLSTGIESGITIFYAQHCHWAPNNPFKYMLYDYIMVDLFGKEEFKEHIKFLEKMPEYDQFKSMINI